LFAERMIEQLSGLNNNKTVIMTNEM
jgi:hypothetical protein